MYQTSGDVAGGRGKVKGVGATPTKDGIPGIPRIQARLRRMADEIGTLLDTDDGRRILVTQILMDRPSSGKKRVAQLDMQRVNNGTLGLEMSQARTVQVHGLDCSKSCLRVTNVLMQPDGTASPAMAAGLRKGDVITRCGDIEATSIDNVLKSVRQAQADNTKFLELEYYRLSGFCFMCRDMERARTEIEDRCYQVRTHKISPLL